MYINCIHAEEEQSVSLTCDAGTHFSMAGDILLKHKSAGPLNAERCRHPFSKVLFTCLYAVHLPGL